MRGLVSRGIGVVRLAHELLRYAQLNPPSHVDTPYTVSPPSSDSSSDGNWVARPMPSALAATWSIEMPSSSAAPAVRRGRAPVRNADAACEWVVPRPGSAPTLSRLVITSTCSRTGASAFRLGVHSKPAPAAFGCQYSTGAPFGTTTTPRRFVGAAAVLVSAVSAGTIPSRSGSANAVPTPRSTVRRGITVLVTIISLSSSSEMARSSRSPESPPTSGSPPPRPPAGCA